MQKESDQLINRRKFLKIFVLATAASLEACSGAAAPNKRVPTLSPKAVATASEQNRLSAQSTAVFLEKNPDSLKENILKIPQNLWINAARIIRIDWSRDKDYKSDKPANVVSTPYSGSCVILGADSLATAGHMLHAPGFKMSHITLDWPQSRDDSIRGITIPQPFKAMRQNPEGIKLQVVSTAYTYDENDVKVPDIGVIKLQNPVPFWSPLSLKEHSVTDSPLYALLMSDNGDAPQKAGIKSFGVDGQAYIPASFTVSSTYQGINDSKFLVAPGPGVRGISGSGVANADGAVIGVVSYSGLDSKNQPVIVITPTSDLSALL